MVMHEVVNLLLLLLSFPYTNNGNFHNAGTWNLKDVKFENVTHMDLLSRRAMKVMHDVLDEDNDGNVSLKEGDKFLAGNKDLVESTGENAKLPGFETDTDGRITVAEFWDSWIKSNVHNWTNEQIVSWLKYDVEMPQYANNFKAYNISGAAFPILACNSSIVSAIVEGSKENRLKLMLKAKEIVLFGPSKHGSNWMKDILLTCSLALALSGIAFGMHVQRTANQTILAIQEKMKALQKSVETMEEEDEFEWRQRDMRSEDDGSAGSNSTEGDDLSTQAFSVSNDELHVQGKLAEVMRELDSTKEALQHTKNLLHTKRNSSEIPADLLANLKTTYQVETSLFEMKKKQVYDNVEHTKSQFQKLQRNRSTIIGVLQFMHSRQIDNFDSGVEQTREEFRIFQNIKKERRRRWLAMEQICKCRFMPSSERIHFSPSRSESLDLLDSSSEKGLESTLSARKRGEKLKKSPLLNKDDGEKSNMFDFIGSKNSPKATARSYAISSHSSAPTLHTQMNETNQQGNTEKQTSKITHSGSTSHLPSSSPGFLQPIPEKTYQTFPKRSPQPRKRRELSNLLERSEEMKKESAFAKNSRKSSSEDNSSLDQTQRSESAHSLPHLFRCETNSVKSSSQIVESSNNLDNKESESEDTQSSPIDKARKMNLKKRTFFTFKKKKK